MHMEADGRWLDQSLLGAIKGHGMENSNNLMARRP